jgi:hypothetical protein
VSGREEARVRWLEGGRACQTPAALWLEGRWRPARLLCEELVQTPGGGRRRRYRLEAAGRRWLLEGPPEGPWRLRGQGPGRPGD